MSLGTFKHQESLSPQVTFSPLMPGYLHFRSHRSLSKALCVCIPEDIIAFIQRVKFKEKMIIRD